MSDQLVSSKSFSFPCPHCRKTCYAGWEDDTGDPYIAHEDEPCQKFMDLSPSDFMKDVNAAEMRRVRLN